ncbi:MAG: organic solvent ABC transporter ATP-binding protein [Bacteroides sp. SM1_62]|nr:MAG: organic solvent ABC transporter ATP-binding protein [Bacteroides sp. SM23_62]KPL20520.1 MAG: organic solvent ABC transporter ATP-binding protein [Bacteroides sp. SM1_62]
MTGKTANNDVVIRVSDLYKTFDDNQVLGGVSFRLNRGETLAILGRSGQGKSVLIKCIVRLILPDAGSIDVLDQDVLRLEEKELNELRIRVGYLFQEGALYDSMTLADNLMFPLSRNKPGLSRAEKEGLVEQTLKSVDLFEDKDKMPAELSGGMRKRAGLARTLVLQPEIILYDEPTTGLDPYTARDINELIIRIQEIYNVSSIVVTHDLKCTRKVSDRVVILQNGNFIARGSYEELENHTDEMIRNYFI